MPPSNNISSMQHNNGSVLRISFHIQRGRTHGLHTGNHLASFFKVKDFDIVETFFIKRQINHNHKIVTGVKKHNLSFSFHRVVSQPPGVRPRQTVQESMWPATTATATSPVPWKRAQITPSPYLAASLVTDTQVNILMSIGYERPFLLVDMKSEGNQMNKCNIQIFCADFFCWIGSDYIIWNLFWWLNFFCTQWIKFKSLAWLILKTCPKTVVCSLFNGKAGAVSMSR